MKKNLLFFTKSIAICICLVFSSCNTEESDLSKFDNQNTKINTVNLNEISFIKEELNKIKLEKKKYKNAQSRSIEDFNLNEDKIIALQKDNYSSYTFIVENIIGDNGPYYVENLVIETTNTSYNAYIVKYIPSDGKEFYNFQDFNGNVKYESLDGNPINEIPVDSTPVTFSHQAFTIGCWDYVIADYGAGWFIFSTTNHCSGGGNTGGGNTGGGNTGGGNTGGGNTGGGNTGGGSTGGGYHSGGGGSGTGGTGNGGSQSSTVPNIPTDDEVLARKYNAFLTSLSPQQYQFLGVNDEVNNTIFNYLADGFFSISRKQFAMELIDLAIDYLNEYGNSTENNNFISNIIKDILEPENDDIEEEDLVIAPDCESFNFVPTNSNWQESAVLNIHFQINVISPAGIFVNHLLEFPQAVLFGCPITLYVGNTYISPGIAANTSAQALKISMNETVKKFGNKPVSGMIIETYFKQRLKYNYPLFIPGGRVNFNANNFSVIPTQYQTNAFGTGDCN
jgi:hypothetical protein